MPVSRCCWPRCPGSCRPAHGIESCDMATQSRPSEPTQQGNGGTRKPAPHESGGETFSCDGSSVCTFRSGAFMAVS
ncbi:hypothetical protein F7D09_0775 [Bifidobacterium leontopitheci]|uniref:Uncharacterized protein n=1 Tax=Bifidobacterium leontopitheci TaxID=2650774 RepID=A0A6I1GMN4_9BIFI|nr:hypothetical protein F7D09_0775 [Bifidobacterium leontopitheci]